MSERLTDEQRREWACCVEFWRGGGSNLTSRVVPAVAAHLEAVEAELADAEWRAGEALHDLERRAAELAETRALAKALAQDLASLAHVVTQDERGTKRVWCTNCGGIRGSHEYGCVLSRPAVQAMLEKGEE